MMVPLGRVWVYGFADENNEIGAEIQNDRPEAVVDARTE
jgi:hypothetical protein